MPRIRLFLAALFCTLLASVSAGAQSVVINKYQNSGTANDIVELLVIQNGLDLRGMILKDFSSNMANDSGGKYQFSNDALWSSVPAGTLLVLRNNNSAADTSSGGADFNLDVGLQNPTYFSSLGGTFDIATTEMVMIKAAGSDPAGVTGSIHALAGGTAGAQFTAAPTPKLRAAGTSGSGQFVYANNSTQSLADFNGTDATGAATGLTFGSGNNANNTAFINSLRTAGPVSEPTVQAANLTFSNVTATTLTLSWTSGNGIGRLVLARAGSPVDNSPADGTTYSANAAFGSGSQLGAGNYVVHAAGGNSVTVTGLAPSTTYYFAVFEYNGSGATIDYLASAPATASQATAAAYSISGQVQHNGSGVSHVTVTLTGGASTVTTTTDQSGNYTFTTLTAGGTYTVTPATAAFSFTPVSQTINNLSGDQTANFTATAKLLISEFRFRGGFPNANPHNTDGALDEFIELYNTTDSTIVVDSPDGLGGWSLVAADTGNGFIFATISQGTIIPARGHYLVAFTNALSGEGYSLGAAAAPDLTYDLNLPDDGGIALFRTAAVAHRTLGNRLDAVGFAAVANSLFREGTGLAPSGGITATEGDYSLVRRTITTAGQPHTGRPQDTDANATDFVLVSTQGCVGTLSGSTCSGLPAQLGAPGPENTSSPIQRNAQLRATLVDPSVGPADARNRARLFCGQSGAPACNEVQPNTSTAGYLAIRRTYTNTTGANISRLRFRIVDITAGTPPEGMADLRAVSSPDVVVTRVDGSQVTVQGTTLEQPPSQPHGGGLNSTLSVGTISLGAPLGSEAPNNQVHVQFLLGIRAVGNFRFLVNVEAETQSTSVHLTMGNPSNATPSTSNPNNYLMEKPQYVLSYSRDRGTPNWVSWHLNSSWLGSTPRQDDFRADPSLPAGWYQVQSTDYSGSGYDRGHMTPSADRTATLADNSATFLMTNMIPQLPANNQGPWADLESYGRSLVSQGHELYIISGPSGAQGTIANGHVTVPSQTWKVIIVLLNGDNDVSRVTTATRTIAVIMPNSGTINPDWRTYRVSVDQVEALTGYNFFSNVADTIENVIEATVDNQ